MTFFNSLQSEWLKLRKSAAAWLVVVGGFFIPIIILISRLVQYEKTLMGNASEGIWQQLFNQCWQYMSIFLLPMGITLVTSLITQIEFRNNAWKQVFASPQSLNTIFWSKYLVVVALLFQFFILFNIGIYLTGIVPPIFYKDVVFPKETFPIVDFIKGNGNFFINSLPILALQYCLSLHIRNFIVPIGVGFVMLIAALIAMGWQHGYLMPYTYVSMQYLTNDNRINPDVNIRAWAVGYFCFFTLLNYGLFIFKNQNTFSVSFKKKTTIVLLFTIPILVCAFFFKAPITQNSKSSTQNLENTEGGIKMFEDNLGFVKYKIKDKSLTGIEARMKNYDIKGLSIAVIHDYKIVWTKAYGWADAEAKTPMTTKTLMQPGSISKSLNALAFMTLYETKKIDLFEDVNTYLTSWQFPYNPLITKGKKITLAQLLSHSAGLNVHGFGFYGYSKDSLLPTTAQILRGVSPAKNEALKSILEPGKQLKYSGGGTMLSQLALMDFTQQPYAIFLDKYVLKPLDMTHSFFTQPPPADKTPLLATGYTMINGGKALKNKYTVQPEQAAAGIWTNPTDLAKMIIQIQKALRGDTGCLISKKTAQLMLTPYNSENASMGFFIDDKKGVKYFQHGAGNPGFSGKFIGSLEGGNGVVVLVNSDDDAAIFEEVINCIANIYEWDGFGKNKTPVFKQTIALDTTEMKKYEGAYQLGNQVLIVEKRDNSLFFNALEKSYQMYFSTKNAFFNIESTSEKTFDFDTTRWAKSLIIKDAQGKERVAKRVTPIILTDAELEHFTGEYIETSEEIATITLKNHELWINSPNAIAPMQAHFLTKTDFYLAENGGIFSFDLDKEGKVKSIQVKGGNVVSRRKT